MTGAGAEVRVGWRRPRSGTTASTPGLADDRAAEPRSSSVAGRRALITFGTGRPASSQQDDEAAVGLAEDVEQRVGDLVEQRVEVERLRQAGADVQQRPQPVGRLRRPGSCWALTAAAVASMVVSPPGVLLVGRCSFGISGGSGSALAALVVEAEEEVADLDAVLRLERRPGRGDDLLVVDERLVAALAGPR